MKIQVQPDHNGLDPALMNALRAKYPDRRQQQTIDRYIFSAVGSRFVLRGADVGEIIFAREGYDLDEALGVRMPQLLVHVDHDMEQTVRDMLIPIRKEKEARATVMSAIDALREKVRSAPEGSILEEVAITDALSVEVLREDKAEVEALATALRAMIKAEKTTDEMTHDQVAS